MEETNWLVFVSIQSKRFPKYKRFKGNTDECIEFINDLIYIADGDTEYDLDIEEKCIQYYGLTKDGSNLIIAAFKEESK